MTDLTNQYLADSTDLLSDTSTSGLDLIKGGYKVDQATVDRTGLVTSKWAELVMTNS